MGYPPAKQKIYAAKHYKANKEKYAEAVRRSRARRQAAVDALRDKPCIDCGGSFPVQIMCFHHIDPVGKVNDVSWMVKHRGLQACLDEAAKCVVLCANCHMIRHLTAV